jgi:hypothetical protein
MVNSSKFLHMTSYSNYYDAIKASTTLWKPANNFQSYTSSSTKYPVSSGGSSGLVMLDGASTANIGGVEAVSEAIGYSLLLAAQYNDKTTFDRISAFIQTAMKASGRTLMPWEVVTQDNGLTWQVPPQGYDSNGNLVNYSSSAADGDINIALGYVYAYLAADTYGWSTTNSDGVSYNKLAKDYIASIRELDFNEKDYPKKLAEYGGKGFPTVVFEDSEGNFDSYEGPRTSDALLAFINTKLGK